MSRRKYCGIVSCPNNKGMEQDIPLFRIPRDDQDLFAKWMKVLTNLNNSKSCICMLHFDPDDIVWHSARTILKPGTVPLPQRITNVSNLQRVKKPENTASSQSQVYFIDVNALQSQRPTSYQNGKIEADVEIKQESNLTKASDCVQCKMYKNKLMVTTAHNENIMKKFQELQKEHRILKAKLHIYTSSVLKSADYTIKSRCEVCYVMLTRTELQHHICMNQTEIICEYCPAVLNSTAEFGEHLKSAEHSNISIYKCNNCTLVFPSELLLNFHQQSDRTHVDLDEPKIEKVYSCGFCDLPFEHGYDLAFHMKSLHPLGLKFKQNEVKPRFECFMCKIEMKTIAEVKEHVKQQHARDQSCKMCHQRVTLLELQQWHLCTEQPIKCDYCIHSFESTATFIEHLDNEHEDKTFYTCVLCGKSFGSKHLLHLHNQFTKHNEKSFECDICSKKFTTKKSIVTHMITHSNNYGFLCATCGKRFKTQKNLKNHLVVHGEKTIKCVNCPAAFTHSTSYYQHCISMHRNVKFQCNQCIKIFKTKIALRRHIGRIHHPSKNEWKKFSCTLCAIRFARMDKLEIHMRKHSGEKPYECEFCPDRRYAYKGDLTKHMLVHVGNNIYKCGVCGKGFRYFKDLTRHSFVHYKPDENEATNRETTNN